MLSTHTLERAEHESLYYKELLDSVREVPSESDDIASDGSWSDGKGKSTDRGKGRTRGKGKGKGKGGKSSKRTKSAMQAERKRVGPAGGVAAVDEALAEVAKKHGDVYGDVQRARQAQAEVAPEEAAYRAAVAVNGGRLNVDGELRRIFGAEAIKAAAKTRRENKAAEAARFGRRRGGRGRGGRRQRRAKKSLFVGLDEDWPVELDSGLALEYMRLADGLDEYGYVASPAYELAQAHFYQAAASMDPNSIVHLAQRNPWHVDTLLQLADILNHSGQVAEATSLIEQALYGLEAAWPASFDVTSESVRIRYAERSNRGLFLVLFKHIDNLSRKGCQGTAFEVCKLLLKLDLEHDPLAVLLMLDYYALRSRSYDQFIALEAALEAKNLADLPNWAGAGSGGAGTSSTSMADADAALLAALNKFPHMAVVLGEKWARATIPPSLLMLETLYVERASSLWADPAVTGWLARVVSEWAQGPAPNTEALEAAFVGSPPRSICRHVALSGYDNVLGMLPRELLAAGVRAYNPFPPAGEVDEAAASEVGINPDLTDGNAALAFLRSLMPWQAVQGGGAGAAGGEAADAEAMAAALAEQFMLHQQGQGNGGGDGHDDGADNYAPGGF
ncbi:uncharacterized protein AMSG_11138 [Thecamonas trahens ATCC 50062]|uniref:Transcription factor 25 n=1 Tax=Thecamonas trahens ATCC 50062 TaxID=461836 RepID=A0A0L0DUK8_THETB|nr:hypothetical protein AMSG_11138 [Thecamonas trahens ATCC 50062]KNC55741.1 hypothetical protein AMSG_11138 [Thecamonas trahens ATCC 50062]|eukprot:XP_013752894.1 hypothetical protein AMSG_11138 [Thecamonas trahens ATCC 50062]